MAPRSFQLSASEIGFLRHRFKTLAEVTLFESDVEFSSKIASYGIFREIGTVNDELARFIFDVSTMKPVRLESLQAEMIEWQGLFGLRIFSLDSQRLELRTKGFYEVIHPQLSTNQDGSLHSLFVFPEIIRQIALSQGVALVLVKSWGMNSIFGGFDPSQEYYQTNFWEIENNDVLKFSDLVRQEKMALMGTHDLIAHIAGIDQEHWPLLRQTAEKVYQAISAYFSSVSKPSISSLILPYTIGVILDDLAQPPSYSSKNHLAVLAELLRRLAKNEIPADLPTMLVRFPEAFQKIIEMSRTANIEKNPSAIGEVVKALIQEILQASVMRREN